MPNPEPLFVDNELLRLAEQMCAKRLAREPNNGPMISSLAKIYRKQGRLTEAATLYARLTELAPEDQEASYMHSVFAESEAPVPPPGIHPAPFVLVKNFLPASFHDTLFPFALSIQDKLVPALVGNNEYNPDARESLDLPGKWDVKRQFHGIVKELIPKLTSRLHVAPFEMDKLEVKLRAYLDGHFFRIHMDCPPNNELSVNRKVSYVYFFHKTPRAYSGGDLLLFDTDLDKNTYTTAAFTRIEPEDNTLVVFASPYFHSVVPVRVPSKEFADSRFVINGHVSKKMPAKLAEDSLGADVPSTDAQPQNAQRVLVAAEASTPESPATSGEFVGSVLAPGVS